MFLMQVKLCCFDSISLMQFLHEFDFHFTSKEKQVLNVWSLLHVWESYFEAVILSNEFFISLNNKWHTQKVICSIFTSFSPLSVQTSHAHFECKDTFRNTSVLYITDRFLFISFFFTNKYTTSFHFSKWHEQNSGKRKWTTEETSMWPRRNP